MLYLYSTLFAVIIGTSLFGMDREEKTNTPPPSPNPVFETVNPPNTTVTNIPSEKK